MKTRALAFVLAALLLPTLASAAEPARFLPLDVVVDTGGKPIAAYQFEFTYPAGSVSIVGIEGGDAPFTEAPFYDPKGLTAGRVVIAAFTTDPHPPAGRVRVARIHVMTRGDGPLATGARLVVAADPDGATFTTDIMLLEEKGAKP